MSIQDYICGLSFGMSTIAKEICYQKISAIHHTVHASVQANFAM